MGEVTLGLVNGVVIRNAVALIKEKFNWFAWEWYDGVATDPHAIEPVDFSITIAMNSRATAGRMKAFMERRRQLEERLARVPEDVRLAKDTPASVLQAAADLFDEACQAVGTKLALASKVLHRKRPLLIPMFDKVVVNGHYWLVLDGPTPPRWFDTTWLKNGAWSNPTMYMRVMAEELDGNRDSLQELRRRLPPEAPTSVSDVRLLEATLHAHLQRRSAG